MTRFDWLAALRQSPGFLPAPVRAGNGADVLLAVLEQYQLTERLAPEQLAAQQDMLLAALVQHCAAQSPYFAKRLKAANLRAGDLAGVAALRRLPPMTRQRLREAHKKLFCASVPAAHGRTGTTSTTGSTGEPVTVRRTELCQQHWMAYTLREHLWHGRSCAGRLAVIRANASGAQRLPDWGPPFSQVTATGPFEIRPPAESITALTDWLVAYQPAELLALPGALAGIVAELESSGRHLQGLEVVRTLSETVTPQLRVDVRRVLGREIADIYSSQEGGVIATQCPEHGLYHVSETIILEVLAADGRTCAPGEVGRVVITDLLNYATPLVRYDIGDCAEAGPRCACGRSSPTIRRFLGRERNLVLLPDGSRHWPTVGFHRWHEVMPIRQFQFVQEDRQTVTVKFSAAGRPTPDQEARLTAIIQEALGHAFRINFVWSEDPLPRGPGGKFEEFVCRAT